ncbi:Alpha-L-fucosidase [Aphelenchoides bicaudatus]|nr:Alpha-L-fucosidase [Aphelenchoides bicaudatus]
MQLEKRDQAVLPLLIHSTTMLLNFVVIALLLWCGVESRYTPDWKSLDSRINPVWYDKSKFGIFVHWGVYSVIGKGEWLWNHWKGPTPFKDTVDYMAKHYANGTTYQEFAHQFTADEFDPDQFAEIVQASGAKYFVLTSKHHEGYTLYPSKTAFSWNSVDVGPHRDLVKELATSIRKRNIHYGLYFSQYEWFHPLYMLDDKNKNTTFFPEQVSLPQMREIVDMYNPDIIWSDGDWDQEDTYWQSTQFIAWLFNDSPVKDTIVVNDRWGRSIMGKHGSFLTGQDNWMPGKLVLRKWENCMTTDKNSWGYRRDLTSDSVYSLQELISSFIKTIAWGGNFLLNVGPNRLGRIPAIMEERLRDIGKFLNAYGEGIYETKPWIYQNETDQIWYTSKLRDDSGLPSDRIYNPQTEKNTIIYAYVLYWEENGWVYLGNIKPTARTTVKLLGTNKTCGIRLRDPFIVQLPPFQQLPFRDVAALKIEYAADSNRDPTI